MLAPILSSDDFSSAMLALLPRGRAWPRDPASVLVKLIQGLAPVLGDHAGRTRDLLSDGFPATAFELLPEWEGSLGLPDPCTGASPTIEQRRAQVLARFIGNTGQSVPFFIAFAATLGFTITIDEFSPTYNTGWMGGTPPTGDDWAHYWQVNCDAITNRYFTCGLSVCGDPLASQDGGDVLQCEIDRLKPAHTIVVFNPA